MKPKLMFKLFTKHLSKSIAILLLVPVFHLFGAFEATAQGGGISGVVKDAQGPVIGASVTLSDGFTGTTTNADGSFTLSNVKEGDTISISFLGYKTQDIIYTGQSFLNVTLVEDNEVLDVVVVTALGIKRSEKALSYNVQQVGADEVTAVKDANFMNSLVGKVAGVQINSGANGAGGSSRVVMRGVKSLTGNNLALYVIDGVPMFNMMNSASGSTMSDQPGTDGVADINPDDIESISMLTGPSAAALYGNAAASGVVLITTKKGQEGKTTVTVSNNTTFSKVTMLPRMQTRYGNNMGQIVSWGNATTNDYDPAKFFNTGANIINTVSVSSGTARNQTYASVSTTNTNGILPNNGYNRYNFTARNTTEIVKDKLFFDFGASFVKQNDKNMTSQGIYYNPLPGLYLFPRGESFEDVRMFERYDSGLGYSTVYWPYGNNGVGMQNPYWVMNRELRENSKQRYMLNAQLKWQITDWLDITGRVKMDNYNNRNTYKLYASTDRIWASENGRYRDVNSRSNNTYADVIATVNKNFGDDWSLNVNLGASINDGKYEVLGYDGNLATLPNFFAIHNLDMSAKYKPQQSGYHDQSQAVFANVEVGWKSMLYLTLTGRNDWESQLAYSNYSSVFYPSVGLSAIISNMFDAPKWLSYLKVRASYTEVGNSYDRFMTTITYPYDGESNSWTTSTTYPNLDLKPERTKSWEAGIDFRLWRHIFANLTYYRSNTFNQTFMAALSSSSGYTNVPIQSGNIMNQGIEMSLGYDNNWGDFSFSTSYTLTWNQNRIIALADGVTNPVTGQPISMSELETGAFGGLDAKLILKKGGSMGDIYANHLLARDFNGNVEVKNGIIHVDATDKFFLGSIFPKANMGWNTHFGWKGLDLGFTVSARLGGIVMSATESYLDQYGVSERSAAARDKGGIRVNGGMIDAQSYYQAIAGNAAYYTYDATNVRLQELSLSYMLPQKWFKDKVKLTVGFVARNLWMIYCKAPFDPEVSAEVTSNSYQGFDSFMVPTTRNLGFNVKLQF